MLLTVDTQSEGKVSSQYGIEKFGYPSMASMYLHQVNGIKR